MAFNYQRAAIVLGPIIGHATSLSLVDLFGELSKAPETMFPDFASVMFVIASSILFENWLEKTSNRRARNDSAKTLLPFAFKIAVNVIICELSLRLLWVPNQYFLRYLRDEKILAIIVRTMFCYFHSFNKTRTLLTRLIEASKGEAGFIFVRNLVAGIYLLSTLYLCNCFQKMRQLRFPGVRRPLPVIGHESTRLE
ncbi:uncharacterized protein LOC129732244 [Wyeomyia smithii]|uniref:uncharacterized protein LOC129732244 n=1 Tax=Wyeomyia smithii TaxID=174621 RepID=UPI0024680A7D|nr:uncharacterized protein LOC129732244 [Wyeomyia smithii]